MPKTKRKHVGPESKVISIYADKVLLPKMQARAKSLGMPLSKYLQYLAKKDLNEGGDFTVIPTKSS